MINRLLASTIEVEIGKNVRSLNPDDSVFRVNVEKYKDTHF